MRKNFQIFNLIWLSLFSIERIFAQDLGFRPIRSRSDIPIEDEDLVGYREMDGQIKKDLNRFEDIKQVGNHWELLTYILKELST